MPIDADGRVRRTDREQLLRNTLDGIKLPAAVEVLKGVADPDGSAGLRGGLDTMRRRWFVGGLADRVDSPAESALRWQQALGDDGPSNAAVNETLRGLEDRDLDRETVRAAVGDGEPFGLDPDVVVGPEETAAVRGADLLGDGDHGVAVVEAGAYLALHGDITERFAVLARGDGATVDCFGGAQYDVLATGDGVETRFRERYERDRGNSAAPVEANVAVTGEDATLAGSTTALFVADAGDGTRDVTTVERKRRTATIGGRDERTLVEGLRDRLGDRLSSFGDRSRGGR